MLWLAGSTVVVALGLLVSANVLRFRRRVAREVRQMWAGGAEPARLHRSRLEELPAPVRRYLGSAVGQRERAVRTVRLRHGGTFRPKLEGAWLKIRGEEYFTADPPGFVWWGRVQVAPAVWIEARDRREVAGVFEFDAAGLPAAFLADRYLDEDGGQSVLTPWRGHYGDYREVDGLLVPYDVGASWQVGGREIPYARFLVERLELDATAPF